MNKEKEATAKTHIEEKAEMDNQYLNEEQAALLRKLRDQLTGEDRDTINSILVQLLPPDAMNSPEP